ncbi:uncharacterized protein Eint_061580 [Encephalitozoon intestinalis ATCC 50506]|uniref:Uncharacterized protein n=1 Tax=Encephalitozoon intestinalis (strain ATCC 50506) TaxID=876142 RepID=E0S7C7_ENCIT|nr:uncharacterized protein Eint_061580 [Encephalitozoon intestinalis ATCC 50506]ADM11762.1 hypothetical protein Eint_061580 [Encephalitozoon intestinalis ATCC 50506]UTX45503.1 hypothetical protein GPK93_06g10610 [Encephalitozoon intestinalis]
MEFFSTCKNYIYKRWRYIEDLFFTICIALQYNCDTNDNSTPFVIALITMIYLLIKTIYGLLDGFEVDNNTPFTVFDLIQTFLIVIHIFVYFLAFVSICKIFECKDPQWRYDIDPKSLIISQTSYMFLASQSIMENIGSNFAIEIVRSILGFYEITNLSGMASYHNYGSILSQIYPMAFSFLPFILGETSSIIGKWLSRNKLVDYIPRVAKTITVIASIMCIVVGIYGTFTILNFTGNITPTNLVGESSYNSSFRNSVKKTIFGIAEECGHYLFFRKNR